MPDDNNLLPDRPGNGYLGGQWKWSNGKPWNFINWDNGQPKNEGSDDCVMIRSKDGLWEDFACTSRLKVLFVIFGHFLISFGLFSHSHGWHEKNDQNEFS